MHSSRSHASSSGALLTRLTRFTLAAVLSAAASSRTFAGDEPAVPVPSTTGPAAPVSGVPLAAAAAPTMPARQAALEAAIHRLERPLARLRKARAELAANRAEPVADELAQKRAELELRGLREVSRYESARWKALEALAEARAAKDAAKLADAAAAVEVIDTKFLDAMTKLEESLDAVGKPAPDDGKPVPSKASAKKAPDAGAANAEGKGSADPKPAPKKSEKGAARSESSESDLPDDEIDR